MRPRDDESDHPVQREELAQRDRAQSEDRAARDDRKRGHERVTAMASRDRPSARPMVIVAPDRDTPGTIATACASPTHSAARPGHRPDRILGRVAMRSTAHSRTPKTMSVVPMSHGAREHRRSSARPIFCPAARRRCAPGMVVIARKQEKTERSRWRRDRADRQPRPSRPTATIEDRDRAARRAARCRTAVRPEGQVTGCLAMPKIHGISVRCADDEIGRNSALPGRAPGSLPRHAPRYTSMMTGMIIGRRRSVSHTNCDSASRMARWMMPWSVAPSDSIRSSALVIRARACVEMSSNPRSGGRG